jgi:hypothetical protein
MIYQSENKGKPRLIFDETYHSASKNLIVLAILGSLHRLSHITSTGNHRFLWLIIFALSLINLAATTALSVLGLAVPLCLLQRPFLVPPRFFLYALPAVAAIT